MADDGMLVAKRKMLFDETSERYDVVFIGDSSCGAGLVPNSFDSMSVLNAGTFASFTIAGYTDMALEILDSKHPPKAIVITFLPRSLEVTSEDTHKFGIYVRYCIAYEKDSLAGPIPLDQYWQLFLRRRTVNRFPPKYGGSYKNFLANLESTKGWLPEQSVFKESQRKETTFHSSTWAITLMDRISEKAKEKDCQVFLCFTPRPKSVATLQYWEQATKSTEKIADCRDWKFLNIGNGVWDDDLFGTESHLTPDGASRFSSIIKKQLQQSIQTSL
ncbi:MAG: hypothetical protein COA78_31965 [Blastopirellula sp.]|nr:MAG: hypothetical protein COA78_31965 [Blastopirellula sp.]